MYGWGLLHRVAAVVVVIPMIAEAQAPKTRLPVPGAPSGTIAFVNVSVVPMDSDRVLTHQTVLVQNGWITAVGSARRVQVPATATRIDGQGKFLLPGLADMHTHFIGSGPNPDTVEAKRLLFAYLAAGVTTVRSMSYSYPGQGKATLALRAQAAAGELLSPRIYASGMWGVSKNHGAGNASDDRSTTKPQDVAAQVAEYKAAGYDHLKSRLDIDPTTEQGRAVFDSLVAAAQRLGMPVVGHVAGGPAWFERNPAALRSIEHMTAYQEDWWVSDTPNFAPFYEKLPRLVALTKQAGVWNCPTLLLFDMDIDRILATTKLDDGQRKRMTEGIAAIRQIIKSLHAAGAGLLLGTDLPVRGDNPGEMVLAELKALVRAGLTPYAALATGTKNVAEFYGTSSETGTVAAGKRADLVLLGRNPLADVQNVTLPAGVMLGGRWLPRESLDRRLAERNAPRTAGP